MQQFNIAATIKILPPPLHISWPLPLPKPCLPNTLGDIVRSGSRLLIGWPDVAKEVCIALARLGDPGLANECLQLRVPII